MKYFQYTVRTAALGVNFVSKGTFRYPSVMTHLSWTRLLITIILITGSIGCQKSAEMEKPARSKPVIPKTLALFQEAFAESPDITIFRLYPKISKPESDDEQFFHNSLVVKQLKLDTSESKALLQSFWNDFDPQTSGAFCFQPHHGLRARYNDEQYDLNICYTCSQVKAYRNGQLVDGWLWRAESRTAMNSALKWDEKQYVQVENRLRERAFTQY